MKIQLITLLILLVASGCSSESGKEDSPKKNFGYYLGMPRYEFENITDTYLIQNTLAIHWTGDDDIYMLPHFNYDENEADDESNTKGFYGEISFNLPNDKLASATLTFRHWGTEWGNESKGLSQNEADEVIVYVNEYLNNLDIKAQLSIIQLYDKDDGLDSEEWFEIIGYLVF